MKRALASVMVLSTLASAADIDVTRGFLEKLRTKSQVQQSEFEFPFLVSTTASISPHPLGETTSHVRTALKKDTLPFKGTYGKTGQPVANVSKSTFVMPAQVSQGDQLVGIQTCTVESCKMKLHTEKEKGIVEKAQDKVTAYHGLVVERLRRYLSQHELLGYEARAKNDDFVRKMLPNTPFLQARYPTVEKFFHEGFWKKQPAPPTFVDSFLRQEMFVVAPDRLQPIWRVGEVFEFKEKNGSLFVEIHVYSNHYIDSSIRIYEVIPVDDKAALVITDVLEIDELTGSSLVRMLYLGKMQQAVRLVESEDTEKIL